MPIGDDIIGDQIWGDTGSIVTISDTIGSGGATCGGTSASKRKYVYTCSAGAVVAGSAIFNMGGVAYVETGGCLAGGTAVQGKKRLHLGTGGALVGGTWETIPPQNVVYMSAGGCVCGGSAVVSFDMWVEIEIPSCDIWSELNTKSCDAWTDPYAKTCDTWAVPTGYPGG